MLDIRAEQDGLDDTIRSLTAQGVPAFLIGTTASPTLFEAAAEIDWDGNPWIMPIAPGDIICPQAIGAYRAAVVGLTKDVVQLIYADDDLVDRNGGRHTPHFKPDWNSELFLHFDYLTRSCIIRTSHEELMAISSARDWEKQLVVRATRRAAPLHLRQMLHHRRSRLNPRVPMAPRPLASNPPLVTIIIPTRNRVELLRICLEGVAATQYSNLEVIVVDNDSDDPETLSYLDALDPTNVRVMRHSGAFNYSAINNRAAREARGQLLCLLNNDIEILDPNWLATMVIQAQREDVGAVGAKLLYPDGRIQHAGVVIGVGNAAGHAHRYLFSEEEGYFHRHSLPQFTTAVTAACLVVDRDKFFAIGGLDERNFAVAFNDVDLCLRLNQRGWQSFYEPRATLIHHESISRGRDEDPIGTARYAGELAALQRLWGTDSVIDPFHHPELQRASERFVLAV
ncbi:MULTISPECIES: glycosyltransferase family 2 protein [unclassified Sphingobium]|uniref:glycosyltransferase family 2 protein n=1 Tax=unclassified Sphingobium TaxID=2611147 RepID=UPI0029CAC2D2|nr:MULTISPECIES: glycosyltransferase family 2 protein [unclassified Sphingobium]MCW2396640.1 GT2 family glycosyltransferase [Sphingobium sp. B8D3B]